MKKGWITFIALMSVINGTAVSSAALVSISGPRPFKVYVSSRYNPAIPEPLIISIAGLTQSGAVYEKYTKLTPFAQADGFLFVSPDGMVNSHGVTFWSATPECCDFEHSGVNDDAYIMKIINDVSSRYSVDPNRIYVIGHSNGGFMANVVACKNADRVAAIVDFSGGTYTTQAACKPSRPISVLEIWGTKDQTYYGSNLGGKAIPGALQVFNTWGSLNHCTGGSVTLPKKINLLASAPTLDATVMKFKGCPASVGVEFWSAEGAIHAPPVTPTFNRLIIAWLLAHPKISRH